MTVQSLRPDRLQSAMALFATKALGEKGLTYWNNKRRGSSGNSELNKQDGNIRFVIYKFDFNRDKNPFVFHHFFLALQP